MRFIRQMAVAAVAALIWAGSATSASATPYIDLMTDMTFTSGLAGSVECQPILISGDTLNDFTTGSDIRLLIPTTYSMTWATDLTAEILTSGTVVVSGVPSYALSPQTVCILDVTTASAAGDKIVVTGLSFQGWSSEEDFDTLGLSNNNDNTEDVAANQGFCTSGSTAGVRLSSANNFSFSPDGSSALTPTLPDITLTDSSVTAVFTAGSDLRITIPAYNTSNPFNAPGGNGYGTAPTFNTAVTTVTVTNPATGVVSSTVTYANGNRTVVLDVTTTFAAGEAVTISGLQFAITADEEYSVDSLQLSRDGGFATINALDNKVFCVGPANITMNAVYTASGNASNVTVPRITITEHATTATITAASDIRLTLLSTNTSDLTATGRDNLSWDAVATGNVFSSYGGTGAAKMTDAAVTTADTGNGTGTRLVLLKVSTDFAAGDVLTVDGLKGDNGLATATEAYIGLIVSGYTDAAASAAFGRVVCFVSGQNVTGSSSTTGSSGNGSCFLRGAEREAAH